VSVLWIVERLCRRRAGAGVASLVLVCAAAVAFAPGLRAEPIATAPADAPAARVDGEVITAGEVRAELAKRFGLRVLQDMVLDWLVTDRAKRLGIVVTDDAIVAEACARVSTQEKTLTTREQLEAAAADAGIDLDLLLHDIGIETAFAQVIDAEVEITEDELKALYDAQIVTFGEGTATHVRGIRLTAKVDADRLAAALTPGNFAAWATAFTEDDAHRDDGGDLGWLTPDVLPDVPGLRAFVENAEVGTVSPVFEAPDGCHIYLVVERREDAPLGFEQARPRLENVLRQQKGAAVRTAWLDRAQKIAKILALDASISAAAPLPSHEEGTLLLDMLDRVRRRESGAGGANP
jgi:foldase protein PrsA